MDIARQLLIYFPSATPKLNQSSLHLGSITNELPVGCLKVEAVGGAVRRCSNVLEEEQACSEQTLRDATGPTTSDGSQIIIDGRESEQIQDNNPEVDVQNCDSIME